MDTPIVTAIITTVGLIIIELIKRPRPPLTPGSEPPPKSPIGNTKGGSSATRVLRVVLLLGLLGSGFVWTYQRIITDQSAPNISITKVPPAGIGGRDHIELIGGTVTGKVTADARVVVYAYAGGQWFVQPDTQFPFTLVTNHVWRTSTHLGAQYAALLVGQGYTALAVTPALPTGATVLSVAQVVGQ